MTSYRERLEQFRLTQQAGARFLGVSERTSRAWASPADHDPGAPDSVMMLFAIMTHFGLTPEDVRQIVDRQDHDDGLGEPGAFR